MQVPPITSHISAPNAERVERRIRVDETGLDTERLPEFQAPTERRRRKDRRKQNKVTSFKERRRQRDRRTNNQRPAKQQQALRAYPNQAQQKTEAQNAQVEAEQSLEQVDAVLEPSHLGQNIDTSV